MPGALPPGRAGRLWLVGRLGVAHRAADLLDRKERLLRSEERRLRQLAARTAADWEAACREAETWTARTVLVGGRSDLRAPPEPAIAELAWHNTMGLAYPSEAGCRQQVQAPGRSANPALGFAVAANRRAVEAAVRHAAASYAHSQVSQELSATRHRRRAITERWVPMLDGALADLEARLDELEREEHIRARWALGHAEKATRR